MEIFWKRGFYIQECLKEDIFFELALSSFSADRIKCPMTFPAAPPIIFSNLQSKSLSSSIYIEQMQFIIFINKN